MKLFLCALAVVPLFALAPLFSQEPAPTPKTDAKAKVPVYDETAIGKDQIAKALAHAKRDNTRVLVQWGANWCGYCKALAELEKSDAEIAKELLYEYEVVKIDIGKWEKLKHADLAKQYGANFATKDTGVPYLTVLDADGKVVVNQATGPLEYEDKSKAAQDPAKVLAFLKSHEAPHVEAQAVYDAALAAAKKDGKRVFLHFGAPTCVWCHRLEGWMEKSEVAAVLAKEFVDCKIDTDRFTGGQQMFDRLCEGKPTGIPRILFLDADGKTLAQSGLGNENIGFPAKPDEIAQFRSMLEKACVKISKDEIAMLADSLVPPKPPAEAPKPADGKSTGTDR